MEYIKTIESNKRKKPEGSGKKKGYKGPKSKTANFPQVRCLPADRDSLDSHLLEDDRCIADFISLAIKNQIIMEKSNV